MRIYCRKSAPRGVSSIKKASFSFISLPTEGELLRSSEPLHIRQKINKEPYAKYGGDIKN